MNLGDNITQLALNSLIYKMLNYMTINTSLNLINGLDNDYINLEVNFNDAGLANVQKDNVVTGNEIIINKQFTITCSDLVFTHLDYFLKLSYYYLPADINNSKDGETLKELIVPLVAGENPVIFEDYPVYLQSDCELLIRKENNVILPVNIVRVKLTVDNTVVDYNEDVVLTATVKDTNIPIAGANVTFYQDDVVVGTSVTNDEGVASCTVNDLVTGDYYFNAVYSEFSSSIVKVTALKMNTNLSLNVNHSTVYFVSQNVSLTGVLSDEFGNPINDIIALYQNGSLYTTTSTNNNGEYTFNINKSTEGTYNYNVAYDGDKTHNGKTSIIRTVNFSKAPTTISIDKDNYDTGEKIKITVNSDYGSINPTSVNYRYLKNNVNVGSGTIFQKEDGSFILPVGTGLDGDYVLELIYNGDANYAGSNFSKSIYIDGGLMPTTLTVSKSGNNVIINYKSGSTNIQNFEVVGTRVYFGQYTIDLQSGATDDNGNISLGASILSSGSRVYCTYGNITSNTITW